MAALPQTQTVATEPVWVDRLTALLLPIVQHRLERRGVGASVAGNLDRERAGNAVLFGNYEIVIAQELIARRLPIDSIHEIGMGFGQLSFLLGWNGWSVVGFESDRARFEVAQLMLDVLTAVDPELSRGIRLVGTGFPPDLRDVETGRSLLLSTRLSAALSPEQQLEMVRAMRRYHYVLVDIDRLFVPRPDAHYSDRKGMLDLFARAGFPPSEPFVDLGVSGCYHLFAGDGIPGVERDPLPDRVRALNRRAVSILRSWLDQASAHRHAAGNYYTTKLQAGRLLEPFDIAVADYCERQFPITADIFELGSGYGELSLLLALKGFRATGIEADEARHQGALMLSAALAASGFEMSGLALRYGTYPEIPQPELFGDKGNILVSTSMTSSYVMEHIEEVYRSLARFDHVIIDVSTFGERRDQASIVELLARIAELGFGQVATVVRGSSVDVRHFARGQASPARGPEPVHVSDYARVATHALTPPFDFGGGHCWLARLPSELADGDNSEEPNRSRWRLRENGVRIGQPHAEHKEIEAWGRGRYSHWQDAFYFAASDNTDPNENSRKYEIEWVPKGTQEEDILDALNTLVGNYVREPVTCVAQKPLHLDKNPPGRNRLYGRYSFGRSSGAAAADGKQRPVIDVFAKWNDDGSPREPVEWFLASLDSPYVRVPRYVGSSRVWGGVVAAWEFEPELDFTLVPPWRDWPLSDLRRVVRALAAISSISTEEIPVANEFAVTSYWVEPLADDIGAALDRLASADSRLPPGTDLDAMALGIRRLAEVEAAIIQRFRSLDHRYLSHNGIEPENVRVPTGDGPIFICDWEIPSFSVAGASLRFLANVDEAIRNELAALYVACLREHGSTADFEEVMFAIPVLEMFFFLDEGRNFMMDEASLGLGIEYIQQALTHLEACLKVTNQN